mgnify:CR=1 FL=1
MKKILLFSAGLMTAMAINAEVAQTLYLIGEPAGGWDTSKGLEMTKTADGVFEINVDLGGKNSFGFVKTIGGDWDSFNSCRYTPAAASTVPQMGENEMFYTGDTTDYSWDLEAGKYHFKVDTNSMKFILSEGSGGGGDDPTPPVVKDDLFFVGEVNDWQFLDEYKMSVEGNIYTYTTGVVRGGISFKLSDRNWKNAYTTRDKDMTPGKTYEVVTGDGLPDMAFSSDIEDAELVLDIENKTLSVRGTAGVDNVSADFDDVPAEYFTISGVKVTNPGPGLYIVRRGAKVTKEYIR